eukprot:gene16118-biopygen12722
MEVPSVDEGGTDLDDMSPSTCNVVRSWENLGIARRSRAPEISETLEDLGKPWNGFWEHLGRGQAAGRPGADKGKYKGNTMVGRALAKPWNRIWETLEKRWKYVGRRWKNLGKTLETLENLGKPLENLGRTLEPPGKPWDRPAADFWMTAAGACMSPRPIPGMYGIASFTWARIRVTRNYAQLHAGPVLTPSARERCSLRVVPLGARGARTATTGSRRRACGVAWINADESVRAAMGSGDAIANGDGGSRRVPRLALIPRGGDVRRGGTSKGSRRPPLSAGAVAAAVAAVVAEAESRPLR